MNPHIGCNGSGWSNLFGAAGAGAVCVCTFLFLFALFGALILSAPLKVGEAIVQCTAFSH